MKKKEKIIGILGGMGPEATIDLCNKIIKLTVADKDQEHLKIIIDNNPKIPNSSMAILKVEKTPLNALQKTALNLEKAGADFTIMSCNTAYYSISSLKSTLNVPILDTIEETAKEINTIKPLVMFLIYNLKAGKLTKENKKSIGKVAHNLILKGAGAIIAGCTEIPAILKEEKFSVSLMILH